MTRQIQIERWIKNGKKEKWKTLMTNFNFTNDKKKVHQHKWNILQLDWQI